MTPLVNHQAQGLTKTHIGTKLLEVDFAAQAGSFGHFAEPIEDCSKIVIIEVGIIIETLASAGITAFTVGTQDTTVTENIDLQGPNARQELWTSPDTYASGTPGTWIYTPKSGLGLPFTISATDGKVSTTAGTDAMQPRFRCIAVGATFTGRVWVRYFPIFYE